MNNKVILMGRLAGEPEISTYTNAQGEQSFRATFTLAIERTYTHQNEIENMYIQIFTKILLT